MLDIIGGSLSNMYGMVLARYDKFPETKVKGVTNIGQLVAFTSQEVFFFIHDNEMMLQQLYNQILKCRVIILLQRQHIGLV